MWSRPIWRSGVISAVLWVPLPARAAWTIPGIVNSPGLNDTRFVSDLTITNTGSAATTVSIGFLPSTAPSASVPLDPGATVAYQNVVERLFGASGVAGALSISSDQPLLIRAK